MEIKKLFTTMLAMTFTVAYNAVALAQDTQTLKSGQMLKINKPEARDNQQRLLKATAEASPYWATAQSFYNTEYGYFSYDDLTETDYCTEITIEGNKVTFSNIVDNSNYSMYGWEGCSPVTGVYDAEKKTVTIETPTISEDKTREDYNVLGEMDFGNDRIYVVLVAGDFSEVPDKDGNYLLYQEKQLVFDVSDDCTELTPRTGYGCYGLYVDHIEGNADAGFMNFYKTSSIKKMTQEPDIAASPATLDLTGKHLFKGISFTQNIKLKNMGLSGTKYTVSTSTDELSVKYNGEIEAGYVSILPLTLTAKESGDFNGDVTFTDQNGKSTKIEVKAKIEELLDYSSVIKNGNIKIYPYEGSTSSMEITNDITGFPVLASTNSGDDSSSGVNIEITVPEGQVATFSWKGVSTGLYPTEAQILLDGRFVNTRLTLNEKSNIHDLSDKIALKSGTYNMTFVYNIGMDWYLRGIAQTKLQAYFYDFDLTLYPEGEKLLDVNYTDVDFGTQYYDNLPKTDTTEIKLYNLGNKEIEITAIEDDGPFSYANDELIIAPFEYGKVKLTFTREGLGEHAGDITLKTTSGDITIHCSAKTEKIIYDYSDIVSKGEFSFDTSRDYPWELDGNKAYSSTSGLTDDGTIDSWIEATFVVSEGNTGTISWSGRNSSVPMGAFMGEEIFTDGTIIYLDGTEITKFAGTMSAGSDQLDSPLTVNAGLHRILFLYTKTSREPEGEDRYQLYDLSLEEKLEIKTTEQDAELKTIEYYSISGIRLDKPTKGVNIIKEIYDNGTIKTKKRIIE